MNSIQTISKIAKRGVLLATENGMPMDHMSLMMDIEATHKVNPLRLDDLLAADDGNFGHDIFGIWHNLNRDTLKLDNCFVPRYSV